MYLSFCISPSLNFSRSCLLFFFVFHPLPVYQVCEFVFHPLPVYQVCEFVFHLLPVYQVFESVAHNYDVMNDAMSLGVHRLWKDTLLHVMHPQPGAKLLDVAGGTGFGNVLIFILLKPLPVLMILHYHSALVVQPTPLVPTQDYSYLLPSCLPFSSPRRHFLAFPGLRPLPAGEAAAAGSALHADAVVAGNL